MITKFFRWISGNNSHAALPSEVGGIFGKMTPEGICGIDPAMDREAIRRHLATLYKRHNDAAGSLDPALRKEAEVMLDAIVACREKYVETVS